MNLFLAGKVGKHEIAVLNFLTNHGINCKTNTDLQTLIQFADAKEIDHLLIDMDSPEIPSLNLITQLLETNFKGSIIALTSSTTVNDHIDALYAGADACLVKPIDLNELLVRINSLYNSRSAINQNSITVNELLLLPDERTFYINGEKVALTKCEYEILLLLIKEKRYYTKENIASHVYNSHLKNHDANNKIYSHIKNLRKKIVDHGGRPYIKSIYGKGYVFADA